MAFLSSLVSSGSPLASPFDSSLFIVPRISLLRGGNISCGKRWQYDSSSLYKYSLTTTDSVSEQGTAVSLDSSSHKDNSQGSSNTDLVFKPTFKPVYNSKTESLLRLERRGSLNGHKLDVVEEKKKVNETLDDVVEKAEKIGSSKVGQLGVKNGAISVSRQPQSNVGTSPRVGGDVKLASGVQKSKPLRRVWRKGDPITSVQKVVTDSSRTSLNKVSREQVSDRGERNAESESPVPPRPSQPRLRVLPKLQMRPSIGPPLVLKKPALRGEDVASTSSSAGAKLTEKSKERKPILIDKFASKKPVADPSVSQAVLTRRKPGKGLAPGKFKDEYRKSSALTGGPRRQTVGEELEISDEETSDFNVSISGAAPSRKGKKLNKTSRKAARLEAAKAAAPVKVDILEVGDEGMLIADLAYSLATSEGEILGKLYLKGVRPHGVHTLDKDMVKMICKEYDVEVIYKDHVRVEEKARKKEILDEEDLENLQVRPPVVTIMGHVDHGKTTLLDYIRKSKVAASEAGGITQGIGAYKVLVPFDGKTEPCIFLDTPGHEAFGAMRARGARVTDIIIIVVAADDGICPQTNEAIAHAKAARVPIVIAINKIDKDGANPERVMQELSSIGLMPEDWGGEIPVVKISALKGENIDDLLETVMLLAELQELRANPHRKAKGTVIEAGLSKSKGAMATFIVQNGTLKRGDIIVCGAAFGKVRALFGDAEKRVDEAGPSIPVQVIGLNNVPVAGDEFEVVDSLDVARAKGESCAELLRSERISAKAGDGKVTLGSLASAISVGKQSGLDLHQLNVIMKVDVQGTIEAIRQALQVLPQDNVTLKFLLQATGDVNTSDVDLAVASKAIILGFNVKAPGSVKSYAENKGVEIRLYRVIYELIDDMRSAMEGLLEPVKEEITVGKAEVKAIFSSGSDRVAGCMVIEGKVEKGCSIRVVRNRKIVHVGLLNSLRRVKEIVKEVSAGLECGVGMEDYGDWEVGDKLEAFNTLQKRRTLEDASASIAAALEGAGIEL